MMNSCTAIVFNFGLSLWELRGRYCPQRSLQSPTQGKPLHLTQYKPPSAHAKCPLVLSMELMDESTVDEPSSNADAPCDANQCTTSVKVDASLIRLIVGKGGKTKKLIERDTTTQLKIPSPREAKRGKSIVVKGTSQARVDDAVSQIHRVLEGAAGSSTLEYSHFISLPLASHPDLVVHVTRFHDSVMALVPTRDEFESSGLSTGKQTSEMEDCESEQVVGQKDEELEAFEIQQGADLGETGALYKDPNKKNEGIDDRCEASKEVKENAELPMGPQKGHGIEESIFIKPATLHITVLMLKLWNKERIAAALNVLQGLKSKLMEALDNRQVSVRLKGLEIMKGSPAKAHVLYAKVEDDDEKNRLLSACKVIKDAFIQASLVSEKDEKQELKMHATLMNTMYRRQGKRFGKRIPFDARPILSMHGSEEWGEYTITEAHLSERFAYDEDGYYHCCGSVDFPLSSTLSTT